MNNARRKTKRYAISLLLDAVEILKTVSESEEEAYCNLPESLQWSEKGDQMSNNIEELNEAVDTIENIIEGLEVM